MTAMAATAVVTASPIALTLLIPAMWSFLDVFDPFSVFGLRAGNLKRARRRSFFEGTGLPGETAVGEPGGER
jgi:hypothetical protein